MVIILKNKAFLHLPVRQIVLTMMRQKWPHFQLIYCFILQLIHFIIMYAFIVIKICTACKALVRIMLSLMLLVAM